MLAVNRENEGKTSLALINNIEHCWILPCQYKYLPAWFYNPIQCGLPYLGWFIPQYLMIHTEPFALLKISEMKNDHNSPIAISNRKYKTGFLRLSFSVLFSVHTFWDYFLATVSLYSESTLCLCGSETAEFISSFILIEVFPRVLNTQTLWFMKICNYTFCLNLQCNLLGYGTKNWKLYKQTNLSFRSNIIWSLETFMCDTPCQTKN